MPHLPVVSFDAQLTDQLIALLTRQDTDHKTPGVISASSLGGCLYHDAWRASTLTKPDWDNGPIPAYLGKAFEVAITSDIQAGHWPNLRWVPPPAEAADHQWSVSGDEFGLPRLKGHLDGVLSEAQVFSDDGSPIEVDKLLEIKLMSPWRYRDFMRGRIEAGKAKSKPGLEKSTFGEYRLQVQLYMGLMGLPECLFVNAASYGQPILEWVPKLACVTRIPFDQELFDEALYRAKLLAAHLEEGIEPECEKHKYCPKEGA